MRWSIRVGSIAGIRVQIHVTFLLFVGWIAASRGLFTGQPGPALAAVVLLLLVFSCVLLHELGHALAARRYGIATRDITLLPIGGIARLERMPEKPTQEVVVALAGPAVNVVIALLIALATRGFGGSLIEAVQRGGILETLFVVNVMMVLFNMVPAFPMDGGRVFRALLAMTMPYERATRIASSVGQFAALLFGVLGLFGVPNVFGPSPVLIFIALFVFLAAGEERTVVQTRASIQGLPVRAAMLTEFHQLDVDDTLRRAVGHLMAGSQQDFPVIENGVPVGVLTRDRLVDAIGRRGMDAPVGAVIERDQTHVEASDPLDTVLAGLRQGGRGALPVTDHGALVGLLTLDNVGDLLLVRQALRRQMGDGAA
jgi:Zn-dependent protease/predicted transcriptional regulator